MEFWTFHIVDVYTYFYVNSERLKYNKYSDSETRSILVIKYIDTFFTCSI